MSNDYSKLKNLNVLIADDEPDLRELLVFELNEIGVNCFEAGNYKDSTKIFKEQEINFIISDFNMPGGTAEKFITEIQTLKPGYNFVAFISGEAQVPGKDKFEAKGISGFFCKPVQTETVLNFILKTIIK